MLTRLVLLGFEMLVLLGVVCAVMILGSLARRYPAWLLAAFSAVIVLTPKSGQLSLGSVAGLNFLGVDPVLAIAGAGAVLGLPQLARRLDRLRLRVTGLVLMIAAQTLIGLVTLGADAALQARGTLVLVGITAFVLSLDDDGHPQELVRKWLYWTAGALCLLALQRAAANGIGTANLTTYTREGDAVTSRVVGAAQIVVVAAAAIQSLYDNTVWHRPITVLRTGLFFIVVLIGQHRSVWAATAAAVALLVVRSIKRERLTGLFVGLIFLASLGAPLIVYSGFGHHVVTAVSDSLSTVSATTGTGGARVSDNGQLIAKARAKGGLVELLGSRYGTPVERIEDGHLVTFSPHNAYVQTLLFQGLVGLALVVFTLGALCRRAWRHRSAELGLAVLFVTFGLAYAFALELAPALAVLFMLPDARSAGGGLVEERDGGREIRLPGEHPPPVVVLPDARRGPGR